MVRAPEYQREAAELQKAGETKLTETVNKAAASAEETKTSDGQESLQALEDAARQEQSENEGEESGNSVLPPEDEQDLRPFPNNHWFISQPVLSEDLREAIFHRVKRDGATVSLASVEFRVSNERVGAVVRLKQMEKEWIAQVSLDISLLTSNSNGDMMRHYKIRLVFRTNTWLHNVNRRFASADRRYTLRFKQHSFH